MTESATKDRREPTSPNGQPAAQRQVRIGLGTKVATIVALLVVTLGLATIWLVGREIGEMMRSEFTSKGEGIARAVAHSAEQLLMEDNPAKLQTLVTELRDVPGVKYIVIAGADTAIINHSFATELPAGLDDRLADATGTDGGDADIVHTPLDLPGIGKVVNISSPIVFGALGHAHVGMDAGLITAGIRGAEIDLLVLIAAFLAIGLGVAFVSSRLIVRPIYNVTSVLAAVATGDLGVEARVSTRDELAVLAASVNDMIRSIRRIVGGVNAATIRVDGASNEILSSSQEQESGVVEQSASLEEIARTMTGLVDTATSIASNADELTDVAETMSGDVQAGQGRLRETRERMAQIVAHNELIADRIADLFEQSQSIISVIDIIDDISDRLDLLALNAALEGSRAGELGKGFSLVAQEMRRLAENVSNSTKEIKTTVKEIHRYTEAATEASREGQAKTAEGEAETEATVEMMHAIFALINRTTGVARKIKVITQQQVSSTQQMVAAMKEASAVAQEGRSAAQEVTRASSELAQISSDLREQVAVFHVSSSGSSSSAGQAVNAHLMAASRQA